MWRSSVLFLLSHDTPVLLSSCSRPAALSGCFARVCSRIAVGSFACRHRARKERFLCLSSHVLLT